MHKFTEAGMGDAPFDLVGVEDLGTNSGHCEYCGKQNIRYQCTVRSADGRESLVGANCAEKCFDYKLGKAVKDAVNDLQLANNIAKANEFREQLEDAGIADWLRSRPHPFSNQAA